MLVCYGIDYIKKLKQKLFISYIICVINILLILVSFFGFSVLVENKFWLIFILTVVSSILIILDYQIYVYVIKKASNKINILSKTKKLNYSYNQKIELIDEFKELDIELYIYKFNDDLYESNVKLDENLCYNLATFNKYIMEYEVINL